MPARVRPRRVLRRVNPETRIRVHKQWFGFPADGVTIPAGSTCVVAISGLHRDPKNFEKPLEYIPERFLPEGNHLMSRNPFCFIPFSAGPRNCIGNSSGFYPMYDRTDLSRVIVVQVLNSGFVGQRFALLEEKIVIGHVLRMFHLKSLQQRDELFLGVELVTRSLNGLRVKLRRRDRGGENPAP